MPPAARKKGRGRPAKPENAKSSAVSNTQKPRKPLSGLIPPKTKPVNGPFTQKQSYEQLKILSLVVVSAPQMVSLLLSNVTIFFLAESHCRRQVRSKHPSMSSDTINGNTGSYFPNLNIFFGSTTLRIQKPRMRLLSARIQASCQWWRVLVCGRCSLGVCMMVRTRCWTGL